MADDSPMATQTFRWDDPLDLSGRLTDDERMIQDAARSYAREKLLPRGCCQSNANLSPLGAA